MALCLVLRDIGDEFYGRVGQRSLISLRVAHREHLTQADVMCTNPANWLVALSILMIIAGVWVQASG